jgi:L-ascorbate 6-phosphate lactonase
MARLSERIDELVVSEGELAVFWLAQAGFAFKNAARRVVYLDAYLSDAVEAKFGFPRMMASPVSASEVRADLVLCTHEHLDHMDTDALPVIAANNPAARFAGPIACVREFQKMGLTAGRLFLLEVGKALGIDGIQVTGVFADHGKQAPGALGLVIDVGGIRVYHTGDTAYRPERMRPVMEMKPDVILPCINGTFGNLDPREAAQLVRDTGARLAIATHFWMFVAHGGDPGLFLRECQTLAPHAEAVVMQPGGLRMVGR